MSFINILNVAIDNFLSMSKLTKGIKAISYLCHAPLYKTEVGAFTILY